MKKPVFIDLFAGCGGLSLGLEKAGFFPIFVNELNEAAMSTYLINRRDTNPLLESKYHLSDIKEMVLKPSFLDDLLDGIKSDYKVTDVDLMVGGPPCQGYSGIGHRRSYSVDKKQLPSNHLYQDYAYVINKVRPKIFLFENVRGLLYSRWTTDGEKGEIWEDVQLTFESIPGYVVRSSLVHAKNYGVPQNRPRVLLVGIREDFMNTSHSDGYLAEGFLPQPSGKFPTLLELLGDLIDPDYVNGGCTEKYPSDPNSQVQMDLRLNPINNMVDPKGFPVTEHEYSHHSPHIVEKFTYMLSHGGQIPEHLKTKKFSQRLLPATWDTKGPIITATSMPDDYVHFSQPRILTVREWARLQLFPDWYQFQGKRTTGGLRRAGNPRLENFERELPKYTQIGNAVPVGLAEKIGLHFLRILGRLP